MSKSRRRTEALNAEFVNGYAAGWHFGVHEAFRANLDITLDTRVDRAANEELAAKLGRKPTATERISRQIWTQGSPPAYSFGRGHMMHAPAEVHRMPWSDALEQVSQSIRVIDAAADEGTATLPPDRDEDDAQLIADGNSLPENHGPGWVEFEMYHYDKGRIVRKENHRLSQADFVQLLKTGTGV